MTKLDIADGLHQFLILTKNWNSDLVQVITDKLNQGLKSYADIDQLLMTCTKIVEDKFRKRLETFTGSSLPIQTAQELLELSVKRSFLQSKDQPLYSLLKWYFLEPRNTSHHQFKVHPLETLMTFLLSTNYLLEEIEKQVGASIVVANFNANYDAIKAQLSLDVSSVVRGTIPVQPNAKDRSKIEVQRWSRKDSPFDSSDKRLDREV